MESPTFLSLVDKVIDELSSYYNTIESWRQVLLKFNDLPTEEKTKYSDEIKTIAVAINNFENFNCKPNAKEMMQIVTLLVDYQSSKKDEVISKKSKRKEKTTFLSIVNYILNNYSAVTASKESLQKTVKMFETLSEEEKIENSAKIKSVLDTVGEYDKFTGEITHNQTTKLHTQLKTYRDYPDCKVVNYNGMLTVPEVGYYKGFQNIPLRKDDNTLNEALDKIREPSFVNYHHDKGEKRLQKLWCGDQPIDGLKTTQHIDGNGFRVTHEIVNKKLDIEDIISEIVFLLLTELGSNSGSGLTIPVFEYFEVIDGILESDIEKYEPITSEIRMCLIEHGWKCKDKDTVGGFHTQPNKDALVGDLGEIINKYFS